MKSLNFHFTIFKKRIRIECQRVNNVQTLLEILRENEVSVCIQGEGTFSSRGNITFKGTEHSGHGTIVPQSC